MTVFEEFVLEKVNQVQSIKGLYPLTDKHIKAIF